MVNLIDRYVYDVIRRLPEKERGDVERELRASIADMLPDDAGEAETSRALETLGDPRRLADQYRVQARYLISPAMMEQYLSAIRIILPITAVIMGLLGMVLYLTGGPPLSFGGAVSSLLSGGASACVSALFITTLGFALADYYQFQNPSRPWSLRDLPNPPSPTSVRIKLGEAIAGMVESVVLIACVVAAGRNIQLFAWYRLGSVSPIPLFTPEALSRFTPWFLLVALLGLAVSFLKLLLGRWTRLLAIVNSVSNLAGAAVFVLFLSGAGTFHPGISATISRALSFSPEQIALYGRIGVISVIALIVLACALDMGMGWYKAQKGRLPA
ncbi:MAG: hypothetical protein VB099_15195 [Candidatus Limiplasma sp.]|nr:hypothetical protein [Candidatus Limiplasma sp.]